MAGRSADPRLGATRTMIGNTAWRPADIHATPAPPLWGGETSADVRQANKREMKPVHPERPGIQIAQHRRIITSCRPNACPASATARRSLPHRVQTDAMSDPSHHINPPRHFFRHAAKCRNIARLGDHFHYGSSVAQGPCRNQWWKYLLELIKNYSKRFRMMIRTKRWIRC
jgi:hypothetical protein